MSRHNLYNSCWVKWVKKPNNITNKPRFHHSFVWVSLTGVSGTVLLLIFLIKKKRRRKLKEWLWGLWISGVYSNFQDLNTDKNMHYILKYMHSSQVIFLLFQHPSLLHLSKRGRAQFLTWRTHVPTWFNIYSLVKDAPFANHQADYAKDTVKILM